MSDATIFYICGGALAVSAVAVSFVGLRLERFPGRTAPFVALWFVALIGTATTFAVLNGKNEEKARASELTKAGEEAEEAEASPVRAGKAEGESKAKPETAAKGPGGTLKLAADPTQLAFDTTTLTSKPGKVTIDFNNPATLEHDVAIEQDGKQIAVSETIAKGKTSVTADLAPGTYTFLCTIPGHAEAGMEGTLTVK
ncbi:MAG TPA: plastocyanin/azurin family copper-binding protein [Solirubrobacterales bacterium]|nr:plastocyanin/azurin family copper-binding protein [Solirubrobacterales bacterium]